jgi:hypothetical protein
LLSRWFICGPQLLASEPLFLVFRTGRHCQTGTARRDFEPVVAPDREKRQRKCKGSGHRRSSRFERQPARDRRWILVTYTLHPDDREHHFAFPADQAQGVVKQIIATLPPDLEGRITTLVVTGSRALARPDGSTAIELQTDIGPVAFQVGQSEINTLRRDLTAAETMLTHAGACLSLKPRAAR